VDGPVLIAYDGSDDARAAVDRATELFPERAAIVLTVWESAVGLADAARVALPGAVVEEAMVALDAAAETDAESTAAEGAGLVRAKGCHATAISARSAGNVASTILAEADRVGAAVVMAGTRGRSAVKAALLGSVSAGLTARSRRPVLVVRAQAQERKRVA
jgi:nucleotide-binding universal stress UspA family protein